MAHPENSTPCLTCDGRGRNSLDQPCPSCNGYGYFEVIRVNRDADQEAELIELSRSQRIGSVTVVGASWGIRLGTQGAWLLNPEGKVAGYLTTPELAETIARLLTHYDNTGGGQ